MRSRRTEFFLPSRVSRAVRWLWPTALLALIPKCFLCVLGYAGLGVALGLGGPELCGAPAGGPGAGLGLLALSALVLGAIGFRFICRSRRRLR